MMSVGKKILVSFFLLFVMLSLWQCTKTSSTPNYSHLYAGELIRLHPEHLIYHDHKDSSKVFYRLNSEELLYVRKDKSEPYHADVLVHYRLYNSIYSKELVDSATYKINDVTKEKEKKYITGSFNIKASMGQQYLLKIWTTDVNRSNISEQLVNVDKEKLGSQFFMLTNKDQQPVFTNFLNDPEMLVLNSKMYPNSTVFFRYYNRNFPLAAPPFSSTKSKSFKYQPDTMTTAVLDENGKVNFMVQDSGFVFFQLDTSIRKGFTLFRYDRNFPDIQTVQGMVPPLRYICTRTEYEDLSLSDETKKQVDKFWLSKTGSAERSKELIRKYYNRVEEANRLFSSYIEGWKTDRGMISMIFGPPTVVNKNQDNEVWIYGEETNTLSLRFTFYKVKNPFSDNDYKLNRGPGYRSSWYRAVDAWRSGRVYWIE